MRLAIDTATDVASVAVGKQGLSYPYAKGLIRGARQHAAQLLPLIQRVLADAAVKLGEITEIVVGDGPGSFTGLRIGWAAAKGLLHDREIPLVAIPSLLGVAHAAAFLERGTGPVAACFDALRGQVFGVVCAIHPNRLELLVQPQLLTIAELVQIAPVQPVLAVGDGAQRYRDEVQAWTGKAPVPMDVLPPIAASLLWLANDERARRSLNDPLAEPVYGRPAEAQAKWESRHGRPLPYPPR